MNDFLVHLDRYFEHDPGFLVFDNAHFDLADARMTVFRSSAHWVLFFETVSCSADLIFASTIHVFGNCLGEQGWLPQYDTPLFSWPADKPLISSENVWIADRRHFSIVFNGAVFEFAPTREQYHNAGISTPDTLGVVDEPARPLPLIDLVRFVCQELNHPFFASENLLRHIIQAKCSKELQMLETQGFAHHLDLLLQTRDWRHPKYGEERVLDMVCFQVLAEAIQTGDTSAWNSLDPREFNTTWQFWDRSKRELFG
jgi:hypothetical protein